MIVIDAQNDFAARGGMFDRAGIDISGIAAAAQATRPVLDAARTAGIPVVYLNMQHAPDLSDAGPHEGPHRVNSRLRRRIARLPPQQPRRGGGAGSDAISRRDATHAGLRTAPGAEGRARTARVESPSFMAEVEQAIDLAIHEHPEMINTRRARGCANCYQVLDTHNFPEEVGRNLEKKGYCTKYDGEEWR